MPDSVSRLDNGDDERAAVADTDDAIENCTAQLESWWASHSFHLVMSCDGHMNAA